MSLNNYEHEKFLADGRFVAVTHLTFSRGRIVIGPNERLVDNGW